MMLLVAPAFEDEISPSHLVQTAPDSLSHMLSRHVELAQLLGCQHPEHSIIMHLSSVKRNQMLPIYFYCAYTLKKRIQLRVRVKGGSEDQT